VEFGVRAHGKASTAVWTTTLRVNDKLKIKILAEPQQLHSKVEKHGVHRDPQLRNNTPRCRGRVANVTRPPISRKKFSCSVVSVDRRQYRPSTVSVCFLLLLLL